MSKIKFLQDLSQVQSNISFSKITGENWINEQGQMDMQALRSFLVISKSFFIGNLAIWKIACHCYERQWLLEFFFAIQQNPIAEKTPWVGYSKAEKVHSLPLRGTWGEGGQRDNSSKANLPGLIHFLCENGLFDTLKGS